MAHARTTVSVSSKLRLFGADARGVAGIEFALTGLVLVIGLLNAVDVGYYAYRRMEVENAAEVGAQAAWKNCTNPQNPMVPATQINASTGLPNCPALNNAITTAIQSTTLAKKVSLASGYPTEGYYCVDSSNALQPYPDGSSVTSPPTACSSGVTPGDYLRVGVTYPYQSLFPGLISVMSVSGISSITKTGPSPPASRSTRRQACITRRKGRHVVIRFQRPRMPARAQPPRRPRAMPKKSIWAWAVQHSQHPILRVDSKSMQRSTLCSTPA